MNSLQVVGAQRFGRMAFSKLTLVAMKATAGLGGVFHG